MCIYTHTYTLYTYIHTHTYIYCIHIHTHIRDNTKETWQGFKLSSFVNYYVVFVFTWDQLVLRVTVLQKDATQIHTTNVTFLFYRFAVG